MSAQTRITKRCLDRGRHMKQQRQQSVVILMKRTNWKGASMQDQSSNEAWWLTGAVVGAFILWLLVTYAR